MRGKLANAEREGKRESRARVAGHIAGDPARAVHGTRAIPGTRDRPRVLSPVAAFARVRGLPEASNPDRDVVKGACA